MTPRRIATLAALVTGGAAGWYFFAYLTRWEWNRALVAGVIFLAMEVAIVAGAVLERLRRLSTAIDELHHRSTAEPRDEQVLQRIGEAAPPRREPFAWLTPDRTSVFVPVLLGAGVIASGVAWTVERLARAGVGRHFERGLARRLQAFALPCGLVDLDDDSDPSILLAPQTRRSR